MINNEFEIIDDFLNEDSKNITSPPEFKEHFFEKNGTLKKGIVIGYTSYIPQLVVILSVLSSLYLLNYDTRKESSESLVNKDIPIINQSNVEPISALIAEEPDYYIKSKSTTKFVEDRGKEPIKNAFQIDKENEDELVLLDSEKYNEKNRNELLLVSKANYQNYRKFNVDTKDNDISGLAIIPTQITNGAEQSNYAITFRGFNSVSNIDTELNNNFTAWNNNLNINIYFYRYKNLLFGAGFGRENVPQRYDGRIDNKNVVITQNPNFYWGTLNARYYSDILPINDLRPFIDAAVGITPYGSVLRSNIGLEYNINSNTSVFLGADVSNFSYSYQNNIFFTNKIGFSYGIKVEL